MELIKKVSVFFQKLWIELTQKVTWPSRTQIIQSTLVLLTFIIIWSAFIGAIDFIFATGLRNFLEFVQVG